MSERMSQDWDVEILPQGRSGYVVYREGGHRQDFYWEFGGGHTVVLIDAPSPDVWPTELPWAADRRAEVLSRVASEVIRQRAHGCSFIIHPSGVDIQEPVPAPGGDR